MLLLSGIPVPPGRGKLKSSALEINYMRIAHIMLHPNQPSNPDNIGYPKENGGGLQRAWPVDMMTLAA